MRILLIVLIIIFMSGCTKYVIEKTAPDGSTTVVNVSSTRDLEQPNLHYQRTGNDAVFDFSAAGVDNNADTFMSAMTGVMGMMMQMMEGMMMKMSTMPDNSQ